MALRVDHTGSCCCEEVCSNVRTQGHGVGQHRFYGQGCFVLKERYVALDLRLRRGIFSRTIYTVSLACFAANGRTKSGILAGLRLGARPYMHVLKTRTTPRRGWARLPPDGKKSRKENRVTTSIIINHNTEEVHKKSLPKRLLSASSAVSRRSKTFAHILIKDSDDLERTRITGKPRIERPGDNHAKEASQKAFAALPSSVLDIICHLNRQRRMNLC